ncbi:hypothetical protein S40285_09490 [Stachybotrys chlorohalonatus IBT 40285]|uniref:Uncharacterized protein n=1 Tax=Stachybotrys chlorohalonatus (strain IBT 40285) TaxID=1283841 RepID=A0A084QS01_STAC4|nr:hypothetical protein S40285_09490 [Stachybotrys chlorohalonata IBT 40285]
MSSDNRRKLIQRRLNKVKQEQGTEERDALLQRLNETLAKDDQSLEAIPEKEWEDMNIDGPDEEQSGNGAEASSQVESSDTTGEKTRTTTNEGVNEDKEQKDEKKKDKKKKDKLKNEKKKKHEKKKDKKTKSKNTKRAEREESVRESIESDDDDQESSIFYSSDDYESDSASDSGSGSGSDSGSGSGSDSGYDSDSGVNVDPDLGKSLYTFPAAKASKDGETVGWIGRGTRSTKFINRYGKKSAAIYRLDKHAYSLDYEEDPPIDQCFSMTKNRYGDKKTENDKLMYTRRHILDIFGIAWRAAGPCPSSQDLDLIDPSKGPNWREVPTKILIAWQVGGEVKKTWETRQCLRIRWGVKEADEIIFKAAQKAQDRYDENQIGRRPAKSKSPSVGLVRGDVERHREQSLGKQRSSPSQSSPRARSQSPQLDADTLERLRDKFLADYLELLGVSSFKDLSRKQQGDCIAAWREEKATLV